MLHMFVTSGQQNIEVKSIEVRSMAGSCNAASGSIVDVDIPELSESP